VTITGHGFVAGATVRFGAAAATNVVVHSSTSITATSPAGNGTVDVVVTTTRNTSATSAADRFSFR
jgi:IPT/TIG domain